MKNRQKRLKNNGYVNTDTKEIKNLILITIGILALAVGLYFLTDKLLSKDTQKPNEVNFDYSICTVGTMFNRPYEKYYVFLYDETSEEASQYKTLLDNYTSKEESEKIYYVDLSNKFNSKYVSDTSNNNPKNPSEVKIKGSALILISNGKVSKYYEKLGDYEKILN